MDLLSLNAAACLLCFWCGGMMLIAVLFDTEIAESQGANPDHFKGGVRSMDRDFSMGDRLYAQENWP